MRRCSGKRQVPKLERRIFCFLPRKINVQFFLDCEQSLSVPQNQSGKHENRATKQRASRRETASREDCGREERTTYLQDKTRFISKTTHYNFYIKN